MNERKRFEIWVYPTVICVPNKNSNIAHPRGYYKPHGCPQKIATIEAACHNSALYHAREWAKKHKISIKQIKVRKEAGR